MALPPIKRSYDSALSLVELERDMRFQEIGFKGVTKILTENGKTVAIHNRGANVPRDSLELREDPNGSATGSAGSTPICNGKAFIQGTEKAVAAFRKGTAAASGSAGAATLAPAQPPAAAAEDDRGTGPEGNPNLNADGTPRTASSNPTGGEEG